jgi:integrase/recombinase XerD
VLDCKSRNLSPLTAEFYRSRVTAFYQWCATQGIEHVDDLNPTHVKKYLVSLQERGLSSAYVHGCARAIKAWLNFCVREDFIKVSPFAKVKMPKLDKRIKEALSNTEISFILGACETQRDRTIILFLADSGVRASELIALDVDDIDMKTGGVTVRMGKGGKDRYVYVGSRTRKAILLYLAERKADKHDPLFVSDSKSLSGERLTYSGLAQLIKRLRKASGVEELGAHALRRTFAINCLRGGMSVYILARLMGHEDIDVLKQYLDLLRDDVATAHAKASPVDRMKK